jgi:hypothetical protein
MPKVGSAYVEIRAKLDALRKDLKLSEKLLKSSSDSFQKTIGAISFSKIALGATAFAGTFGFAMKQSIDAASSLQEATQKFGVVFKDQIDVANKFAKELVDGYNLSTREARQFLASIQDLLVPMGLNSKAAANLSGEIVKLSADIGSFQDKPTAKVLDDIQSALSGNYETMKKYGVVLNVAAVQQEALNSGLARSKDEISVADKAQAAFNLIVKGTQAAVGDTARSMGTYAYEVRRFKAGVEDLKAAVGQALLPELAKAMKRITDGIKGEEFQQGVKKFASGLRDAAEGAKSLIETISKVPPEVWRAIGGLVIGGKLGGPIGAAAGALAANSPQASLMKSIQREAELEARSTPGGKTFTGKIDANTPGFDKYSGQTDLLAPVTKDQLPSGPNQEQVDTYAQLAALQKQIIEDAKNTELNPLTFASLKTDKEQLDYQDQYNRYQDFIDERLAQQEEYSRNSFDIEAALISSIIDANKQKNDYIRDLDRQALKKATSDAEYALDIYAKNNETAFKVQKAYRLSEATISGISAAVAAWNAGMSVGGPYAPAIAAAYTAASIAATAAQISAIASTQYGGGGRQPGVSAGGGSGISYPTDLNSISNTRTGRDVNAQQQQASQTVININSPLNDKETADYVIGIINDAADERDVTIKYAGQAGGLI